MYSIQSGECLHETANNRMQIPSGQRARASDVPLTARKTFISDTRVIHDRARHFNINLILICNTYSVKYKININLQYQGVCDISL